MCILSHLTIHILPHHPIHVHVHTSLPASTHPVHSLKPPPTHLLPAAVYALQPSSLQPILSHAAICPASPWACLAPTRTHPTARHLCLMPTCPCPPVPVPLTHVCPYTIRLIGHMPDCWLCTNSCHNLPPHPDMWDNEQACRRPCPSAHPLAGTCGVKRASAGCPIDRIQVRSHEFHS